jgi:hypothetical protein
VGGGSAKACPDATGDHGGMRQFPRGGPPYAGIGGELVTVRGGAMPYIGASGRALTLGWGGAGTVAVAVGGGGGGAPYTSPVE